MRQVYFYCLGVRHLFLADAMQAAMSHLMSLGETRAYTSTIGATTTYFGYNGHTVDIEER